MSFLEHRNEDVRLRRKLLTRTQPSGRFDTCRPQDSRSARRLPREPIYLSFVTKAILWDRGVPRRTAGEWPRHSPQLRPRFLSLMKGPPDDLTAPHVLTSGPPLSPLQVQCEVSSGRRTQAESQTPEGFCRPVQFGTTVLVQTEALMEDKCLTVADAPPLHPAPPPVPATPPSSTNIPTPLSCNSGVQPSRPNSLPGSPVSGVQPVALEEHVAYYQQQQQQQQQPPAALAPKETVSSLSPLAVGSGGPTSPISAGSCVSLSDLSRPSSSLFSRSTSLSSSRRSFLSAVCSDSNPDDDPTACSPPLPPSPSPSLLPNHPSSSSPAHQEPICDPARTRPPRPASAVQPLSSSQSGHSLRPDTPSRTHPEPSSGGRPVLPASVTFPSATWSSCPSPQSSMSPNLSPSGPAARLESLRWPVLPSISPVRGRCSSAASGSSEISCSPSQVFEQLEAIAPRSTSCPSLDDVSDSSGSRSPNTDVSPGLAALTMGCDSDNLGAMSRVQLLLLDRVEAGTPPSPISLEEDLPAGQDWSQLRLQHLEPGGGLEPLSSDWFNSPGEIPDHRSQDSYDGHSGSPSSWIIDREDASSPCSSREDSDPSESSATVGWKSGEEEQRRTKAINLLSKLQEDTPLQPDATSSFCNFEDFDFLAKYCIFSQEKLAEYKRAFQEADADGDGYISCLQVLLTLKAIVPPELLSEEEEIYVYKILEMVDFKVTDGLVDLRLFAVIASLAQKVACMDDFMRSLIVNMDFRSLEVRLFKAKQLFLFLLEEQRDEPVLQQGLQQQQQGFISAEQLLLELKAGGIRLEHEAAVRLQLQHVAPLDLLDFLAHLPLFMLIHKSVISNPLDDSSRRL